MYDNARDAASYLNNTVAFWDGSPIYIDRIEADFSIQGYKLPLTNNSMRENLGNCQDKRFQCREFRLGYINWSNGAAIYAERRPHRGVQQGLCDNNVVMLDGRGNPQSMSRAIREQGFVDMLLGKYPSPAEASAKMERGDVSSVAFERYLAVARHANFNNLRYLKYKGRDVSWSDNNRFKLPDEFKYLREICEPTGILERAA